ncbi:hypothetical protein JTE90_018482 [Oedothorax gibbosus]|uniref:Uncharacterized protein n=1 Tax=Oedothorax gibbosus TaxID=931172 RepID=A0AAV6UEZ2_9ARAC|nr:hypothetical protein JTE90_018482 [Oedothorax gibbosus]
MFRRDKQKLINIEVTLQLGGQADFFQVKSLVSHERTLVLEHLVAHVAVEVLVVGVHQVVRLEGLVLAKLSVSSNPYKIRHF